MEKAIKVEKNSQKITQASELFLKARNKVSKLGNNILGYKEVSEVWKKIFKTTW